MDKTIGKTIGKMLTFKTREEWREHEPMLLSKFGNYSNKPLTLENQKTLIDAIQILSERSLIEWLFAFEPDHKGRVFGDVQFNIGTDPNYGVGISFEKTQHGEIESVGTPQ